jgi:hypothetical protein
MKVKQSPKLFGGISIIAMGNLFQLKPVMDSYIFSQPRTWVPTFGNKPLNRLLHDGRVD